MLQQISRLETYFFSAHFLTPLLYDHGKHTFCQVDLLLSLTA
jgi:hypothetical protein